MPVVVSGDFCRLSLLYHHCHSYLLTWMTRKVSRLFRILISRNYLKKLNDFSSVGDHAYDIKEYKENTITPQAAISVIKEWNSLPPEVMLGWYLDIRCTLHVRTGYFHITIRDITFFFIRRYWVYMFWSQEIWVKLTNLVKLRRLRTNASLKYKLKEPLYTFSANCAFHEPKKLETKE